MAFNVLDAFRFPLLPRNGKPGIRVVRAQAVDPGPPIRVTALDTATHLTVTVSMVSSHAVVVGDEVGLVTMVDGTVLGILIGAGVLPADFLERDRCVNVSVVG